MLPRLYLITDRDCAARGVGSVGAAAMAAVEAGVRMIQFRAPELTAAEQHVAGHELVTRLAGCGDCKILINDRADLAEALGAAGVHRPQRGLPVAALRRIIEAPRLIGVSCHGLDEALEAFDDGADFITLSPIFETSSKPDAKPIGVEAIERVASRSDVPVYALGGVTPDNCRACIAHGAHGVAVMSGIMAADDPYQAARAYMAALST